MYKKNITKYTQKKDLLEFKYNFNFYRVKQKNVTDGI